MHDFWWHFWNDPMRDNPWSLGALLLLVIGAIAYAINPFKWRNKP